MKKILVVDDEESVRIILKKMLEEGGYIAEVANNGEEALEAMKGTHFDMLISDINMPAMNGVELLNNHRGHEGRPCGLHRKALQDGRSPEDSKGTYLVQEGE
jgi:CheY-like chemotaxis protein